MQWALIGEVCGQLVQEPEHLASLPCGFEALYQVSRLGWKLLRDLLGQRAIRPDLSEAKVKDLVKLYRPELARRPALPPRRGDARSARGHDPLRPGGVMPIAFMSI